METIAELFSRVAVGEPATFANLTLFPLLGDDTHCSDYATLDEALEQGWLAVSEISGTGSVPELKVVNSGDRAVLMLDGEELRGAKQNRVLNLTILVPAGRTMIVPVSCVEQGRWARSSVKMTSSRDALYAKARIAQLGAVSRSYARTGRPMSDQLGLWASISSKAFKLGVKSRTEAMSDIFAQHGKRVSDYERAFHAADRQCGAVFAIGKQPLGLELFGHPDLLRKLLRKIVRSYALDAIEASASDGLADADVVPELLEDVARGRAERFPAAGLGEDVRIRGRRTTGAALVVDGRVVHLCAFRNNE